MNILLKDLLMEGRRLKTEEETPPPKKKRGRPSKADVAAREAAKTAAKVKKGQSSLSPEIRADIEAAKARRAAKDAEIVDATKKELDAAMANAKSVKAKTKTGKTVRVHALPTDDTERSLPSGTARSRKSSEDDSNDTEYDIDKARANRGVVNEGIENRVSHLRLNSVLADLSQHLDKSQQDKLAEMFVELEMLGDSMNQIPYSIFTHNDWKMLKMVYMKKVTEMQEEIEKLQKDKKDVDFHTVMKVLQFMLTC